LRFDDQFIEKVRGSVNIVDVISEHTQLKRSGHRWTGLCPFPDHREKTGSFSISEDKQLFFCFGCKKHGDVFSFFQQMRGLSFPEAVRHLAERAHIPLPANPSGRPDPSEKTRALKRSQTEINAIACAFFEDQLKSLPRSHPVNQYLQRRGLGPELVRHFRLGFAPEPSGMLKKAIAQAGGDLNVALDMGLLRSGQDGGEPRSLFWKRLMFPILAPTGEVLGFGGRVLDDSEPKYINSSDSDLFHKGRVLYGLHESAKYIRTSDRAIVVEGYMDFLAVYGAGIKEAVATLGTALTENHARLIKRYTKNVLVLFDGDKAGQKAAERSLPILLGAGLLPKALVLPDGLDPDDYLKSHGIERLRALMGSASDLFMVFLDQVFRGYSGQPSDLVGVLDRVVPVLDVIEDRRLRDLYLEELAFRLRVEVGWLRKHLPVRKTTAGTKVTPPPVVEEEKPNKSETIESISLADAPRVELVLLNIALHRETYFKQVFEEGLTDRLTHPGVRGVFLVAQKTVGQSASNFDRLASLVVPLVTPAQSLMLFLQTEFSNLTNEEERRLFEDCKRRIETNYLKFQARKMKSLITSPADLSDPEKLEQIVNIQKRRLALSQDKD
jgi:DNA primase